MTTRHNMQRPAIERNDQPDAHVRFRVLWGIYILVILALGLGRTIEKVVRDSGGLPSRYGPALGATVIAIGVAGYALSKPVGRRWLWRVVLVLAFLGMLALFALECIVLLTDDAPWRIHAMIIAGSVLLIPAQIALYRYVMRWPA